MQRTMATTTGLKPQASNLWRQTSGAPAASLTSEVTTAGPTLVHQPFVREKNEQGMANVSKTSPCPKATL
ncbi:hypothetical protein TRIHO_21890 [Tritonibacter horizontis]|uniref:Uncharacterized protein n=1 Tax=Tritonibacter horizontis TaxID=1768241 RepID=A0A132BX34_9RHOB|nr:hypothetical protein TRIHO_21890 [Tritonibacter horizontis]